MKICQSFTLPLLQVMVMLCAMPGLHGEIVVLEDKKGAKMEAQFVECDDTILTVIRQTDQKKFTLPLVQLSEQSVARVKALQASGGGVAKKYTISVSTGKSVELDKNENYDDKQVSLTPVVTIANGEQRGNTRAGTLTALFLGRSTTDNSLLRVFSKEEFDLPALQPGESRNFDCQHISEVYDSRGSAKYGARYIGYVVIVHDGTGKEIYDSKSVPVGLIGGKEMKFLKLESKRYYNRDLRPVGSPSFR